MMLKKLALFLSILSLVAVGPYSGSNIAQAQVSTRVTFATTCPATAKQTGDISLVNTVTLIQKTAGYNPVAGDCGAWISFVLASSATTTLPAGASVGAGWGLAKIANNPQSTAGAYLTVNVASSGTINGASSYVLAPGCWIDVTVDANTLTNYVASNGCAPGADTIVMFLTAASGGSTPTGLCSGSACWTPPSVFNSADIACISPGGGGGGGGAAGSAAYMAGGAPGAPGASRSARFTAAQINSRLATGRISFQLGLGGTGGAGGVGGNAVTTNGSVGGATGGQTWIGGAANYLINCGQGGAGGGGGPLGSSGGGGGGYGGNGGSGNTNSVTVGTAGALGGVAGQNTLLANTGNAVLGYLCSGVGATGGTNTGAAAGANGEPGICASSGGGGAAVLAAGTTAAGGGGGHVYGTRTTVYGGGTAGTNLGGAGGAGTIIANVENGVFPLLPGVGIVAGPGGGGGGSCGPAAGCATANGFDGGPGGAGIAGGGGGGGGACQNTSNTCTGGAGGVGGDGAIEVWLHF